MRLVLIAVAVAALASRANADPVDRPQAFEIDREAPPPGRAEFSFDGGGPIGPLLDDGGVAPISLAWALGVQLGYLDQPMTLASPRIEIIPVERRQTVAPGVALAIGPSVVVDARFPMSHQTGDRLVGLGDLRPLDRWVLGDLGLGVRLRLMTRERFATFVRGQLTFGTGDDRDFAGEARYTAAWMLIGRVTLAPGAVIAATAGVRFRGAEVIVGDRLLGDELFGAIGASYPLPAIRGLYCDANHVRITGELVGVLGNDIANQRGASPVEARAGVIGRIRPWLAVAVRAGTGLDDQIGAPRFRAMVELDYIGTAE
jgi:hypothetical protein